MSTNGGDGSPPAGTLSKLDPTLKQRGSDCVRGDAKSVPDAHQRVTLFVAFDRFIDLLAAEPLHSLGSVTSNHGTNRLSIHAEGIGELPLEFAGLVATDDFGLGIFRQVDLSLTGDSRLGGPLKGADPRLLAAQHARQGSRGVR